MTRTTIKECIASLQTDIHWIKDGIKEMHKKQDLTNGRINRLENLQDNYVTKEVCTKHKTEMLNRKLSREIGLKDKIRYMMLGVFFTVTGSIITTIALKLLNLI
jgi:hypothetical protein